MGILIHNYFECILICLDTWKIFCVKAKKSFREFDDGGCVQEFNCSEYNNVFLNNIYGLSLGYSGELQCDWGGLLIGKVNKIYKTIRIQDRKGFTRNVRESDALQIRNKGKIIINKDGNGFHLLLSGSRISIRNMTLQST